MPAVILYIIMTALPTRVGANGSQYSMWAVMLSSSLGQVVIEEKERADD